MNKKQKILVTLFAVVMLSAVFCRAYGNYKTVMTDDKTYVELTNENRGEVSKYDVYTQYECGLKVNWLCPNEKGLYHVRTVNGFDAYWSKEAIAEYVSNSKQTEYFQ